MQLCRHFVRWHPDMLNVLVSKRMHAAKMACGLQFNKTCITIAAVERVGALLPTMSFVHPARSLPPQSFTHHAPEPCSIADTMLACCWSDTLTNKVVMERPLIVRSYLQSWFAFDCISTIPFNDLLSSHSLRIAQLVKVRTTALLANAQHTLQALLTRGTRGHVVADVLWLSVPESNCKMNIGLLTHSRSKRNPVQYSPYTSRSHTAGYTQLTQLISVPHALQHTTTQSYATGFPEHHVSWGAAHWIFSCPPGRVACRQHGW
jgi:hypothetical protein